MCRREWANSMLEQTSLSLLASPVSFSVGGLVLAEHCDVSCLAVSEGSRHLLLLCALSSRLGNKTLPHWRSTLDCGNGKLRIYVVLNTKPLYGSRLEWQTNNIIYIVRSSEFTLQQR